MTSPAIERGEVFSAFVLGYGLALLFTRVRLRPGGAPHADGTAGVLRRARPRHLVQMLTHFRFFLHIDGRQNSRPDLQLLLFSAVIVALMVGGTLVVLFNLYGRMM